VLAKVLAWRGVIAIAALAMVSLWLAWEGMLGFYIHPRYNVFTISMAFIAVVLLAIAVITQGGAHDHDHHATRRRRTRSLDAASLTVVGLLVAGAVVLPPATLSSATAENRSSNEVDALGGATVIEGDAGVEIFATLTVRDWASLLTQNQNPAFYRGKPVDTIGIVTADESSDDVFFLTRFVVTCCAVDAQPVSIPVYLPGWRQDVVVDSWVRIEGGFQPSPSGLTSSPVVLVPLGITEEEVPREPYLF
jgi:putative membrane protein